MARSAALSSSGPHRFGSRADPPFRLTATSQPCGGDAPPAPARSPSSTGLVVFTWMKIAAADIRLVGRPSTCRRAAVDAHVAHALPGLVADAELPPARRPTTACRRRTPAEPRTRSSSSGVMRAQPGCSGTWSCRTAISRPTVSSADARRCCGSRPSRDSGEPCPGTAKAVMARPSGPSLPAKLDALAQIEGPPLRILRIERAEDPGSPPAGRERGGCPADTKGWLSRIDSRPATPVDLSAGQHDRAHRPDRAGPSRGTEALVLQELLARVGRRVEHDPARRHRRSPRPRPASATWHAQTLPARACWSAHCGSIEESLRRPQGRAPPLPWLLDPGYAKSRPAVLRGGGRPATGRAQA